MDIGLKDALPGQSARISEQGMSFASEKVSTILFLDKSLIQSWLNCIHLAKLQSLGIQALLCKQGLLYSMVHHKV